MDRIKASNRAAGIHFINQKIENTFKIELL